MRLGGGPRGAGGAAPKLSNAILFTYSFDGRRRARFTSLTIVEARKGDIVERRCYPRQGSTHCAFTGVRRSTIPASAQTRRALRVVRSGRLITNGQVIEVRLLRDGYTPKIQRYTDNGGRARFRITVGRVPAGSREAHVPCPH